MYVYCLVHPHLTLNRTEENIVAMEIVSPIFPYEHGAWRRAVCSILSSLSNEVVLQVNESCGLHVHISPDGKALWTLRDLKHLSRAILYFEPAIERLVPPHRRQNIWARSNYYDNPKLHGKGDSEVMQMIDGCQTLEEVVSLMNNGSNRNYAWNFTNIYSGGSFTIEFRRGPGAAQENTCLQWVEFVINFVHAAKCGGTQSQLAVYSRDVEGLMHFFRGYTVAGGNMSVHGSLFASKSGFLQPCKMGGLTEAEEAKVNAKDKEANRKNMIMKKWMAD